MAKAWKSGKRRPWLGRAFLASLLLVACGLGAITTASPAAALTTAAQLSAGGQSTCAVMSGGNAYCWGDNTYGELGNGTTTSSATPVLVSGGLTWASLSTNTDLSDPTGMTCGVTTTGVGYCWGSNLNGEVGDGTTSQRNSPTAVSGGYTWSSISVGRGEVCGVTTAHVGYCWGDEGFGELGNGSTTGSSSTPVLVNGSYTWATISAGSVHACGLTTGGAAYCWGWNGLGTFGSGNASNNANPTLVAGGYTWAAINTGVSTTCGITTSNVGYCWGSNGAGDVGNNTNTLQLSPALVSGGYSWAQIDVGSGTTCGITTSSVTYCWGHDFEGELGNGTTGSDVWVPTLVSGGLTFSMISTGPGTWSGTINNENTNCGLALDGIIYCWGYNQVSQIGDGTTTTRTVPTEASLLFAATANTTASVTITPTFTFTVANQSSACNGELNFVGGAGTAASVALGNLAAGANVSGGQALSVTGNSGGGFAVYVAGNQATNDLRSASHNWADVAGSYASPAALGAGERFGYTYKDSTSSSSVTNPSSANFAALTNTNEAVMGSGSSTAGNGCISFDAQASASTPAASYTATIIYTAVPTF